MKVVVQQMATDVDFVNLATQLEQTATDVDQEKR